MVNTMFLKYLKEWCTIGSPVLSEQIRLLVTMLRRQRYCCVISCSYKSVLKKWSVLLNVLLNCADCNLQCSNDDTDVKCKGGCERNFHTKCIKSDVEVKKTHSYWDYKCKDCPATSLLAKSVSSLSEPTILTKDLLLRILKNFKHDIFDEIKSFCKEMS